MTQVAIFKHYIYGTSGTELMPPLADAPTFAVLQGPTESEEVFHNRTHTRLMELRRYAEAQPVRDYSIRDSWDVSWHQIRDPEEFR